MARKPNTLAKVIEKATARALTAMEHESDGFIPGYWKGEDLASWVAPKIIRAVKRHLGKPKRKP